MLIRIPKAADPRSSEITPLPRYLRRREFLRAGVVGAGALLVPARLGAASLRKLDASRNAAFSTDEEPTDYDDATRYNNFYEFGTDKEDPARNAHTLVTRPWSVVIEGAHRENESRIALEEYTNFGPRQVVQLI